MSGQTRPLLDVHGLSKHYPIHGGVFGRTVGTIKAVDDVSFSVRSGETLGLVGESGCGKSTLGRTIMRLEAPSAGRVVFDGHDVAAMSTRNLFKLRREVQMIFQDPYSSLNPRMTVGEIVREPMVVHRLGTRDEQMATVRGLLETVGLAGEMLDRYPHEFSGGQRQRIGVARALALSPRLVIADEPVSALDVSVRSQVLNLMSRLQQERGLTYIFISHDLSVVEHVSDAVAIMYLGHIVEHGPSSRIFQTPAHPYTRALLQAIPVADPRARRAGAPLGGEAPSPIAPPPGCVFSSRCPFVIDACRTAMPALDPVAGEPPMGEPAHLAACIRTGELPPFVRP